jgi:subfamily B ATP-binding cassette protein HlyB/CyaB
MQAEATAPNADTGLLCLVLIARFLEVRADPRELQHEFAAHDRGFTSTDIVRAARWLGLRSRSARRRLDDAVCPCIAGVHDDQFVTLAAIGADKLLIRDPLASAPREMSKTEFDAAWTGELILIARRTGFDSARRQFNLAWFAPFILKYRRYFAEVLLASFFLQLFALVTPLFFQVVVDKVLVHQSLTTLDLLAFGLLVVSVFDALLGGLRGYVFSHTTNRIDVALGAELFRHLLRLPLAYFEARRVGDIVARVRELETLRNFITGSSLTLIVDASFTVVFFAVLLTYSGVLTLVVAATLPCYIALALIVTPQLRHRLNEKCDRGADNQAYLVEAVTGIETLKAGAIEPATQRRFEERLAAYVGAAFRATSLSNVAGQVAGLINKLMILGILWFGARLVIDGALTVGQLVAFNMIAARVSGPILRLVQLWQDFQRAAISLRRLGDILNAHPEPASVSSRSSLPEVRGHVSFDRVAFRYRPDGPEVLRDITLDVAPGEMIGIVGRSGSGKSSFAKLIQRLYVPVSGRVMVDGVDLALVDMAWLRRRIGVVLQENRLFNRSVRENIAITDPTVPLEHVLHAAELAGAHEFILDLPEGYDTVVGEQGSNLSGGQRQRIAIARALITNPRILIFDEATSALDYESEAVIQRNMQRICAGRTVFMIAHRLSSVRAANRIIVIDDGRIVQCGSHAELASQDGYYAHLIRLQANPGC